MESQHFVRIVRVVDPGHIYEIPTKEGGRTEVNRLIFVKRSGGAVTYPSEWPGVQTQAVMRAVIHYLKHYQCAPTYQHAYNLWQLGSKDTQLLVIRSLEEAISILRILIDRSWYLNDIIPCVETADACVAMDYSIAALSVQDTRTIDAAIDRVRHALWAYEARAYRRKQEEVNRKQPTHDDTARLRAWREFPWDDVPFTSDEIELRPIGPDGHIVL